jgi:cyclic beta-1,2-glucan synthetase
VAVPRAHLLSNGRYRVLLTDAGGGYSSWQETALTRWNADRTQPTGGLLFYVRDLERRRTWSAGLEPMVAPGPYSVEPVPGRVRLMRECDGIESRLDVVVAAEPDAEYRELTLTNRGRTTRRLDVTTYLEVTLNDQMLDALHPAFSKLFIQTEAFASCGTLLARRGRRSPDEPSRWLGHRLLALETGAHATELETDRARFIGRAHVGGSRRASTRASACQERRATF